MCCRRRWSAAIRSPTGWSTAARSRRACRACARRTIWRMPEPLLEQAQDDATIARDPRHGARRHRHRHRRRDPPRELLEPVRDRARRHRSRATRRRSAAAPATDAGAARRRPDPARAARSRCATCSSCAATPSARPRSRCPARSRWRSRRRTSSTRTRKSWRWTMPPRSTPRLRDLKAAGADVIQLDEPWLRNAPRPPSASREGDQPRARGHPRADRVHLCFGYAAVVEAQEAERLCVPPELARPSPQQISIEAAQPKLDLGMLRELAGKTIMLGVLDLSDPSVETRRAGGGAHPRRA